MLFPQPSVTMLVSSLPGSPSDFLRYSAKSPVATSAQRTQGALESSSEENAGSPSPPPTSTANVSMSPVGRRQDSLNNSQSSRSDSSSVPLAQLNGFHRSPPQEGPPAAQPTQDSTPPALPPKTRKAQKVLEVPKEPEYSDRGDSDMDEDTSSGSPDKLKPKKVESVARGMQQCWQPKRKGVSIKWSI